MKPNHFNFDRTLYQILQSQHPKEFTVRKLRDEYAQSLKESTVSLTEIRKYIYTQIRRMLRIGWITYGPVRAKRNQVYHLHSFPENMNLVLVKSPISRPFIKGVEGNSKNIKKIIIEDYFFIENKEEGEYLSLMIDDIKFRITSSLGELECYQKLMKDLPQIKEKVEKEYDKAQEENLRLMGQLNAIEKIIEKR